jgi:hypothetical protein
MAVASRSGQRSSRMPIRDGLCAAGSASTEVRSAEVLRSTAICARSPVIGRIAEQGGRPSTLDLLPNSLTVLQLRPRPSDALRGRLIAAPNSIQLTMIDSKTATTTVFISSPRTLCTLTTRRMELLRTVVSVTPNVAEQPIAR